jgi:transcriptional regulator with XRE-family HTH domain
MESLAVVFGRRVKELRKAKRMTQEELGRAAKMDYKHIGAIERGVKSSSFGAIEKLADALDVDYYELFLPSNRLTTSVQKEVSALVRNPARVELKNVEEFLRAMRSALKKLDKQPD